MDLPLLFKTLSYIAKLQCNGSHVAWEAGDSILVEALTADLSVDQFGSFRIACRAR